MVSSGDRILSKSLRHLIMAVQEHLNQVGIPFALAGSCSLWMWGYRDRKPHDIDLLVGATKEHIHHVFSRLPGMTTDEHAGKKLSSVALVQYHYLASNEEPILLDFYLVNMKDVVVHSISGAGLGKTPVAGLMVLFKAKIHALATRGQAKDLQDVQWLFVHMDGTKGIFRPEELSEIHVGLSVLNFPALEVSFRALGVNVDSCKNAANHFRQTQLEMTMEEYKEGLDLSKRIVEHGIRSGLPVVQQSIPQLVLPQVAGEPKPLIQLAKEKGRIYASLKTSGAREEWLETLEQQQPQVFKAFMEVSVRSTLQSYSEKPNDLVKRAFTAELQSGHPSLYSKFLAAYVQAAIDKA